MLCIYFRSQSFLARLGGKSGAKRDRDRVASLNARDQEVNKSQSDLNSRNTPILNDKTCSHPNNGSSTIVDTETARISYSAPKNESKPLSAVINQYNCRSGVETIHLTTAEGSSDHFYDSQTLLPPRRRDLAKETRSPNLNGFRVDETQNDLRSFETRSYCDNVKKESAQGNCVVDCQASHVRSVSPNVVCLGDCSVRSVESNNSVEGHVPYVRRYVPRQTSNVGAQLPKIRSPLLRAQQVNTFQPIERSSSVTYSRIDEKLLQSQCVKASAARLNSVDSVYYRPCSGGLQTAQNVVDGFSNNGSIREIPAYRSSLVNFQEDYHNFSNYDVPVAKHPHSTVLAVSSSQYLLTPPLSSRQTASNSFVAQHDSSRNSVAIQQTYFAQECEGTYDQPPVSYLPPGAMSFFTQPNNHGSNYNPSSKPQIVKSSCFDALPVYEQSPRRITVVPKSQSQTQLLRRIPEEVNVLRSDVTNHHYRSSPEFETGDERQVHYQYPVSGNNGVGANRSPLGYNEMNLVMDHRDIGHNGDSSKCNGLTTSNCSRMGKDS